MTAIIIIALNHRPVSCDHIRHAVEAEIVSRHVAWVHGRAETILVVIPVDPAIG